MFNIIKCRNCGTNLNFPSGKAEIIAKCPKCGYKFITDTSIPKFKYR